MDQVLKLLKRFPKDTACANSGDRAQQHSELISCGLSYIESFTTYLNLLLAGKAPVKMAPYIASAHLIPLLKADNSIRPIAVGEIIRRLLSTFCAQSVIHIARDHLGNVQQGIGKLNAIETILLGLNRIIDGEEIDPNITPWLNFKMLSVKCSDNGFLMRLTTYSLRYPTG
jgi:hypothetical protein